LIGVKGRVEGFNLFGAPVGRLMGGGKVKRPLPKKG